MTGSMIEGFVIIIFIVCSRVPTSIMHSRAVCGPGAARDGLVSRVFNGGINQHNRPLGETTMGLTAVAIFGDLLGVLHGPAGGNVVELAEDVPGPLDEIPRVEKGRVGVRGLHLWVGLDGLHEVRQALSEAVASR